MTNQNLTQVLNADNNKAEELQDADLQDISGGAKPKDPEADCLASMSCGTYMTQTPRNNDKAQ